MRTKIGLVLGLLLALAVAGCGKKPSGDGVATAGGGKNGPSASATPSLDPEERTRKWQQCLAEQGIDVQVGSDSDGASTVRVSPGPNLDPQKAEQAMEKCKQYAPGGGETGPVDPAMEEAMRNFSKCMRENGVPNFPDPGANGGLMINKDSGIDPESDTFKAAQQKCQALMPRPSIRATR